MRVLLYSSTSRTHRGGVQRVYDDLAAGLRRRGHEVVEAWGTPPADGPDAAAEWTVPLHTPRFWNSIPRPASVVHGAGGVWRLLRGLRRHRPDVVHLHFVRFDAAYFLLLRLLFGYRVVLTFHGSDLLYPERVASRTLPALVNRADAVTAVSGPIERALDDVLVGPDSQAVHIPNGVDVGFWSALEPAPAAVPTVVAVGRLARVKGFGVLIEAVRRLRETSPDVRLVLVGEGEERSALERQAAEAGLAGAVAFRGYLDRLAVRDVLRTATVFALPSRSEGFPLAVLEAMAAGLPVVATRVGGVPDVVRPGVGRLVPPDDPEALAAGLRPFVEAPAHARSAGAAASEAVAGFSTASMVAAYEDVYEDVVGGAGPTPDPGGDAVPAAAVPPAAAPAPASGRRPVRTIRRRSGKGATTRWRP